MRVLQLCVAGLGWDRLRPLMQQGLLPAFAKLASGGASGMLRAPQPQVGAQLEHTVLTGLPAHRHGRVHALRARDGAIAFAEAADAAVPCLPDWLAQAGVPALWVGWTALAPRAGPHIAVVPRCAIADAGIDAELPVPMATLRVPPEAIGPEHIAPFFPGRDAGTLMDDPEVPAIAAALADAGSLQAAATWLMRQRDWRVASMCLTLVDDLGARFADCHPPLPEHADAARALRYRHVLVGGYRFLDMLLARLVALAGDQALVLVHGDQGSVRAPPPRDPDQPVHRRHRASHDARAALLLAGPGVRAGASPWGGDLADVAPTLARALGVAPPYLPTGRWLAEAFAQAPPPPGEPVALTRLPRGSPAFAAAARDEALARGEGERDNVEDVADALARVDAQSRLYRALSLLQDGQAGHALELLDALVAQHGLRRYVLHQARACLALGRLDQAREGMERFVAMGEPDLRSHLMLGRIHLQQGEHARALVHFFQAGQLQPEDPVTHTQIGEAYRRAGKLPEAMDAFGRALEFDPGFAEAHVGLCRIALAESRDEDAIAAALAALGGHYRHPDAHYHLGVALARCGRGAEAITAFETCLALVPSRREAHRWLAELYRAHPDGAEQAVRHRLLADATD